MPRKQAFTIHPNARSLPLAHRRISDDSGRRHSWCTGSLSDDQTWYYTSSASTRSSSTGSSPRRQRRQRFLRSRLDCSKNAQRSPDKGPCAFSCGQSVDKSDLTLDAEDLSEESHLKLVKFDCLDSPCPETDERREHGHRAPPNDRGPENTRRSSLKTAFSRSVPCCEYDKKHTVVFIDLPSKVYDKPEKKVTIRLVDSLENLSPPSPAPQTPEPTEETFNLAETFKNRGIVCRKYVVKETHITNTPISDEDLEEQISSKEVSQLWHKYRRSEPSSSFDCYKSEPTRRYDYNRWEPSTSYEDHRSRLPSWYDTRRSEPASLYEPRRSEPLSWYEPHSSEPHFWYDYQRQHPSSSYKYRISDPPSSFDYYRSDPSSSYDYRRSDPPSTNEYYRSESTSWNESHHPPADQENLRLGQLVDTESTKAGPLSSDGTLRTGQYIDNKSRRTDRPESKTYHQTNRADNESYKTGLPICTEPRKTGLPSRTLTSRIDQAESNKPSITRLTTFIEPLSTSKTDQTTGNEPRKTDSHISKLPCRTDQSTGPKTHKADQPVGQDLRKTLPTTARETRRTLPSTSNKPRKVWPISKTGPSTDKVNGNKFQPTVDESSKSSPAINQPRRREQFSGPTEDNETRKKGITTDYEPRKTGTPIVDQPRKTGSTISSGSRKTLPATDSQPRTTGPPVTSRSRPTGLPTRIESSKASKTDALRKEPGTKPALKNQQRKSSDLDNFKADNTLYSPKTPDVDPHLRGRNRAYSELIIEEYETSQFTESYRPQMRKMNPLEDHERKIIIEFCHLLEKSKQLFNGLRELPQYGHKQWHSYFGRTFDVYTKLWKFQQQHRAILDCKYGLKRWQIGEIASKIGQLYYHFYLRTSDTAYLNEAFSFYSAIRGRCYYTKASKEDKCELMVKKLRYYARFIVVCLLLKKIKLVRELTKELDRQIIEYGNTYDPDDQMEWIVVVDEVKAFIQAEPVITVSHPDNYPVVITYRLNASTLSPVERSSQNSLSLQEVVIVGSSNQVKFSELTMDMYRMLHSLEREPSESTQHLYDDSPRPRFISTPCAPTSKGYLDGGRRKDNPHKYLLFKPSPAQVLVYLSSGCHDLPPNGALLLYISADGHIPPQSKQPDEAAYEMGGLITTSKNDIYRENRSQDSKAGPSAPKNKEPHCLYPGDLLPFTRRPLFVIIDSDNSHIFHTIPRHFGVPLVILMSPVELPDRLQDRKQHGNLFTLFLHSPLSAFCYITEVANLTLSLWEKAMDHVDSFLMEATALMARSRVDSSFLAFMCDDFLRLLLLRFIFCEVVTRRHRSFRNRNHFAKSSPTLPEELCENPTLTQIIMDLASILQVRGFFQDPSAGPPNAKE